MGESEKVNTSDLLIRKTFAIRVIIWNSKSAAESSSCGIVSVFIGANQVFPHTNWRDTSLSFGRNTYILSYSMLLTTNHIN